MEKGAKSARAHLPDKENPGSLSGPAGAGKLGVKSPDRSAVFRPLTNAQPAAVARGGPSKLLQYAASVTSSFKPPVIASKSSKPAPAATSSNLGATGLRAAVPAAVPPFPASATPSSVTAVAATPSSNVALAKIK